MKMSGMWIGMRSCTRLTEPTSDAHRSHQRSTRPAQHMTAQLRVMGESTLAALSSACHHMAPIRHARPGLISESCLPGPPAGIRGAHQTTPAWTAA